jgi:hypothetical protein
MAKRIRQTQTDSKGRVARKAEAWLHDNPAALASVRRGVKQARSGRFAAGPRLHEAKPSAGTIEDD